MKNFINHTFKILTILFIAVSCNIAEQESVEGSSESSISASSFNYNQTSLTIHQNTTSIGIIPMMESQGHYFQATPTLPAGLRIDPNTGVISGVPTVTSTSTQYVIKATSANSEKYAYVTITVNSEPVKTLTYNLSTLNFTKLSYSVFTPSYTGGAPSGYSISPAIGNGLNFNSTSGAISGSATLSFSGVYTVTATNAEGSVASSIFISVGDATPSTLNYSNDAQTINVGDLLTTMVPSLATSPDTVFYSVTPSLPTGLSLNSDGTISGTPTKANGISNFTITSYNNSGSTSTAISLTVNDPAVSLSYPSSIMELQQDILIGTTPITSYQGGTPVTFSCTGCPTGIVVDSQTGSLSGKTTDPVGIYNATISASHAPTVTQAQALIDFYVVENYPEDNALGYQSSYTLYENQVVDLAASPVNGLPTTWSITPDISTFIPGLIFNTTTGKISGTPSVVTAPINFTIVGENLDQTSTSVPKAVQVISIEVKELAPLKLGYNEGNVKFAHQVAAGSSITLATTGTTTRQLTFNSLDANLSIDITLPTGVNVNYTHGIDFCTTACSTTTEAATDFIANFSAKYQDALRFIKLSNAANVISMSGLRPLGNEASFNLQTQTYSLNQNVALTTLIAPNDLKGGDPTTYSVYPSLPLGLTLNSLTGELTGTPTEILTVKYYTITATNAQGSYSESIAIEVGN